MPNNQILRSDDLLFSREDMLRFARYVDDGRGRDVVGIFRSWYDGPTNDRPRTSWIDGEARVNGEGPGLKECPKCLGVAEFASSANLTFTAYHAMCNRCGMKTKAYRTKETAAAIWNSRKIPLVVKKLLGAMRMRAITPEACVPCLENNCHEYHAPSCQCNCHRLDTLAAERVKNTVGGVLMHYGIEDPGTWWQIVEEEVTT